METLLKQISVEGNRNFDLLNKFLPNTYSINNYRLIIGDAPYKNPNDVVLSANQIYAPFNKQVAFLCDTYKASLFFAVSVLCGSHDKAKDFLKYICKNKIPMSDVAEWLFSHKKMILVNRNDINGNKVYTAAIQTLLSNKTLKIDKVLILGSNQSRTSKTLLSCLSTNGIMYEQIIHPSPHAYAANTIDWCNLYLKLDDSSLSAVKYSDFRIF